MNKGDTKTFNAAEVNKGNFTEYGETTLSTIPIYVKGSFVTFLPDQKPWYSKAGEGAYRWLQTDKDKVSSVRLVALEDNSEFHCMFPRVPAYYHRKINKLSRGETFKVTEEQFVYLASGEISVPNEMCVPRARSWGDSLTEVKPGMSVYAVEDSLIVRMSKNELTI